LIDLCFTPTLAAFQLYRGIVLNEAARDKVYQLLAHGRWFSPSTPASSTTKTCHHVIAEILLKVALNTKKSNHVLNDNNNHM